MSVGREFKLKDPVPVSGAHFQVASPERRMLFDFRHQRSSHEKELD